MGMGTALVPRCGDGDRYLLVLAYLRGRWRPGDGIGIGLAVTALGRQGERRRCILEFMILFLPGVPFSYSDSTRGGFAFQQTWPAGPVESMAKITEATSEEPTKRIVDE